MSKKFRKEKDVLGKLEVPANVYWGINTQRAIGNFKISGITLPEIFIKSLAQVKKACLLANMELGLIEESHGKAIVQALNELISKDKLMDQFPIDVFQTGSGTQTNMNMNEVIANRANEILGHPLGLKEPIHPNDHINKAQSSNDVIPTAMHISIISLTSMKLIPLLEHLKDILSEKVKEFQDIIKVGRTHLQDAVPIPLAMEFDVYYTQIDRHLKNLSNILEELQFLPIGGTALGTGIGADKNFAPLVIKKLNKILGKEFDLNPVRAEGIASHNNLVYFSSQLRQISLTLIKMANDIRWMGSGPRAGLGELILPQNEPGSSIMPGKINPTQSEALIQVCIQIMGFDSAIAMAESHGSILDLNVCKPLIIYNILESVRIMSNAIWSFTEKCLKDLKPNLKVINSQLEHLLMIVTTLSPYIGYDKASQIAQKAYKENKTIKEVIKEDGLTIDGDLDSILDPKNMV